MTDLRQLPLFSSQPNSPEDLNRYTRLRDTFALFQQVLMREGKSMHTVNAFTSDLQLFAEFTGETTLLGTYTTTILNEFLHWLEFGRGVSCSRKSYARRVTTLKVFFKWLHSIGAIPDDPARPILQRSGPAPLAVILSPDEVDAALAFTRGLRRGEKPDARPELLFRLLVDTGIKKSEAMRLTPADVLRSDPDAPALLVRQKGAKDVYKERKIDLRTEWPPVLDEYLAQYTPRAAIFNCTARNLEYVLEDVGRGAGIEPKLSFEMLRWTCAVRDYRADVDPELIREKLGLSRISWQETFAKIRMLTEAQRRDEE
jgi:integrase/recombinase XerD